MGGLWLDPDGIGHNLVRKNPWSTYFTSQLVLLTNPHRRITNSDLELAALVLYEAILLEAVSKSCMAAPRSGYDNTQTVYWSTHESSMINPVVVDLLRICTLHSRFFFSNPSVFYHPGQENCMAYDASCLFHLSDTAFITHMSAVHTKSHVL